MERKAGKHRAQTKFHEALKAAAATDEDWFLGIFNGGRSSSQALQRVRDVNR